MTTAPHDDLVFQSGRRPASAGVFVQQIYALLAERPGGLDRDEIDTALREGWCATDAYRRYELKRTQKTPSYDSEQFKERARQVYTSAKLRGIVRAGFARLGGGRYYIGSRVPRVSMPCPARRRHLVAFDAGMRELEQQRNEDFVRREHVKSELLQGLNDRAIKGNARKLIKLAHDYLSGR